MSQNNLLTDKFYLIAGLMVLGLVILLIFTLNILIRSLNTSLTLNDQVKTKAVRIDVGRLEKAYKQIISRN